MKDKEFMNAEEAIDIITIADKSQENALVLTAETFKRNNRGRIEMVKYKMHLQIKKENKYTPLFKKVYKSCKMLHDKAQAILLLKIFYQENNDKLKYDVAVLPTIESKKIYDDANFIFAY